jgi:exonuclease SbcC
MKNVNFKSIKIVNFLSIGREPVVIDFKEGLNIITGINHDKTERANGVGKSTILDAIYYAIYGATMRDLKKDGIPNFKYSDETCEVVLKFDIEEGGVVSEHKIIRTISPTKCNYFIDGEDKTLSTIAQTNSHILSLLQNTSPIVFQNSVIMTLNNTVPFMALEKADKRKFIEGILDLNIFGDLLKSVKEDHAQTKRVYETENIKYSEYKNSLDVLTKQNENFEENKNKRISSILEKRTASETILNGIAHVPDESVVKYKAEIDEKKLKVLENDELIAKINTFVNSTQTKVNNLDYVIKTCEKNKKNTIKKTGSCDFCSKNLSEFYEKDYSEKIAKIDEELKKAQEDKVILEEKLKKCAEKMEEVGPVQKVLKQSLEEFREILVQSNLNKNRYNDIKSRIAALDEDLKIIREERNLLKEAIDEKNQKMEECKVKVQDYAEKL